MKNLIKSLLSVLLASYSFAQSNGCGSPPNLPVNGTCVTQAFTNNQNGTNSAGIDASCGNATTYEDAWYTITGTGNTVSITMSGTNQDGTLAAYTACNSGEIACDFAFAGATANISFPTTLGTTYYIQIQRQSGSNSNNMSGDICAVDLITPANDDCAGAISLTVNPDQLCGTVTAGTVAGATASPQSTTDCFGTENDDVWFSFVATATAHSIDLQNVAGSTTDMYHSVWEGTCPTLTLVTGSCSDADNSTPSGLTIGNTYYVRVNTWSATAGATSTFDICIGTPVITPPPANDDCAGAISLTVNPDELCGTVTSGTVEGGTPSAQSTTDCFGTENDDVWFSFVATSTTHSIDLLNIAGSTTDMYHSVWEGTCPTLTLVTGSCSDPNSSQLNLLTIGNTYYVRVNTWSSTFGATSTFDICIGTPPPVVPPGSNSTCVAPDPVCSGSAINFTSTVTGLDAEDDINPGNNYDCLFTSPDPTWYYLEISGGGDLVIDMTAASDIDYAIWGPFADLATAQTECNSYGLPLDCSYSTSATEQANVTGTVVGEVYVLVVTNYAGTVQTISISDAPSNTATTDCSIVPLPVELVNFDGMQVRNENILTWTTVSELNNDHFIVERSLDGQNWSAFDLISGQGTSNATTHYESIDSNPGQGTNYYRLRQFDTNGNISFSDVIAVIPNNNITVNLIPNPAQSNVVVNTNDYFNQIDIINMQGRVVKTQTFNAIRKASLDISDLDKGVYNVLVQTEKGSKIERLIVM